VNQVYKILNKLGVGKTSIITRYINNTFSSNFTPTFGSGYGSKTIKIHENNIAVKFEVIMII
jgi:GTPase SAR1 family protein